MAYVELTPSNVEPCVGKDYDALLENCKEVKRFQCPECRELLDGEYTVTHHLLGHAIDRRIAELWEQGRTLKEISDLYHMFQGTVPDRPESDSSFLECHHNITKENCFTISYLQGCEHPAYRIVEITSEGKVKVWGIGSGWQGGYGSYVSLRNLRDPQPASELYDAIETRRKIEHL